ncbi:MAG: YfiR family protein [Thermoanaerobaculia bacterium]
MQEGLVLMPCLRLAGYALAATLASAPVPLPTQYALLLKVLTADRNFPMQGRDDLVIGIVYQRNSPASREVAERLASEIERRSADEGAASARYRLIDVSDPAALAPGVAACQPGVLYVAPLTDFDVRRIAALSRARKIRTATGVPAYVESGLAVGFESDRGAVRIVINREASRAEGADFSSKLLKLARRIE